MKDLDSEETQGDEEDTESLATSASGSGPDFNYLLGMPLWSLTKEKKEELLKQRDAKVSVINLTRSGIQAEKNGGFRID